MYANTDHRCPITSTVTTWYIKLLGTTTLKQLFSIVSRWHSLHDGLNCTEKELGKYRGSLRQTSVGALHCPGLKTSLQLAVEKDDSNSQPQTAQAQGWERAVILLSCKVPLGQQKDSVVGGLASVVMSLLYLNCQQIQLWKWDSTALVMRSTSSLLFLESDKAPNSVSIPAILTLFELPSLLSTVSSSKYLHALALVGSPSEVIKGQYKWQLKTCLSSSFIPPGVSRKPIPKISKMLGSKKMRFFLSASLIFAQTFLQKGSRYLLLGDKKLETLRQIFAPAGSLMISQPTRLGSYRMNLATSAHMFANQSARPLRLEKKACWNSITSQVKQNSAKLTFLQSSLRGYPSLSYLILAGRGRGKVVRLTVQSGNPSPQNFFEKRS